MAVLPNVVLNLLSWDHNAVQFSIYILEKKDKSTLITNNLISRTRRKNYDPVDQNFINEYNKLIKSLLQKPFNTRNVEESTFDTTQSYLLYFV